MRSSKDKAGPAVSAAAVAAREAAPRRDSSSAAQQAATGSGTMTSSRTSRGGGGHKRGKRGAPQTFAWKLFSILDGGTPIVAWSAEGRVGAELAVCAGWRVDEGGQSRISYLQGQGVKRYINPPVRSESNSTC